MFTSVDLSLSAAERGDLEHLVRATSTPAGIARRARCVLLLADGATYAAVCTALAVTDRFIARWKQRYVQGGILALADAPRSGRQSHRLRPAVEARILRLTQYERPPAPLTHWTSPRMAERVGVSPSTVQRVWQRAGLQPHRLERYVASADPAFEQKAADVIGLYLDPPDHAVVLCVDEKTAIQALDRLDPVLPLSPGRAERHGFEYYRHGTLSLYAALEVATGRVKGMPAARHTSADFVRFLDQLVAGYPRTQELHVILDNLSAHKTQAVTAWQAAHPTVHFHFTPTYSSWLNQVELWFAKIERDLIARGVFTSVPDLRKKLLRYIRLHNTTARHSPGRTTIRNTACVPSEIRTRSTSTALLKPEWIRAEWREASQRSAERGAAPVQARSRQLLLRPRSRTPRGVVCGIVIHEITDVRRTPDACPAHAFEHSFVHQRRGGGNPDRARGRPGAGRR